MPVRGRAGTSRALKDALRGEQRRLRAEPSAVEQVCGVGDVLATLEAEYERLNDVRMDGLLALRGEGLSYEAISAATGLSRSRVAQLLRQARTR